MKSELKNKIKRIPIINNYLYYKKFKQDSKIREIVQSYLDGKSVIYKENKIDNKPEGICYIKIEDAAAGFFACWFWTLKELLYADKFGLIPYVDWTNKSVYYEEDGINGAHNPFEYYFEQKIKTVDYDNCNVYKMLNVREGSNYIKGEDLQALAKINKKYMVLNENVRSTIHKDIKKILNNKKTLAVHVRGVEWGEVKGHPMPIGLEIYENQIDIALKNNNFEQIFLATDSEDTIEYMSKKYEGKIVFYNDVARAKKGSKTLAIFDDSSSRKNNKYLMGLEVLRDMLTLASCDGIIAGRSNISAAAEITKITNDSKYEYKHIFEPKINKNGMAPTKAVAKMKKGKF